VTGVSPVGLELVTSDDIEEMFTYPSPSPVGTVDFSPALQRWVRSNEKRESRRDVRD